jgi:hypothetical protein
VSDQPTHYVLSDEPCIRQPAFACYEGEKNRYASRCSGCTGNGRRLDVESRVAVEPGVMFDGVAVGNWPRGRAVECWVPGTTEETP